MIRCASAMPTWQPLGKHRYFHEVDLVVIELHGELGRMELQFLFSLFDRIEIACGYYLAMYDSRGGASMGPEARHLVAERSRTYKGSSVSAVVGPGIAVRTIIQLILNAMRLVGGPTGLVKFCATPEEAQAWLAYERMRLANQPQQTDSSPSRAHGRPAGRADHPRGSDS